MVWPFLMGGAAALCATSWLVKNGHAFKSSALILSGFIGARVIMALPINGEYLDVIFAGMWVSIATSIPAGSGRQLMPSVAIKLLVLGAALCSLWGRLSHHYMHLGSLPYATADTLVVLAMLLIGWALRHDVIGKLSQYHIGDNSMGSSSAIRAGGSMVDEKVRAGGNEVGKKSEALLASKVKAHG